MRASSLSGAGGKHDSLNVLWEDTERVFCKLWRDGAEGDRHAFIPVVSGAEHSTLECVNRLTHESVVMGYFGGAWALRPADIVREWGGSMVLVEQTCPPPLDRVMRQ